MATVYKIHPAIGVARVGNSPDEFFVGPERLRTFPEPPGGYKDDQCRIKRQAARFRIYAHHDDGTVAEVTDAQATINWTVHLANTKAAHPDRGNTESAADLTIDPGPRTLTGPNQRQAFDTGTIRFTGAPVTTVPLGEVRSTPENRLLVLGGSGRSASPAGTALSGHFWASDDWYDDVADGPVTATITLRADGSTPPVTGAWILVAPPKFAPDQDSVVTLYDRITAALVEAGRLPAPATTSYTHDVYPVLQRTRDTGWVEDVRGVHTWTEPVIADALRTRIFNRLITPSGGGGNMPRLNDSTGDGRLTSVQYLHLERWKDKTYRNDWQGVPPPEATVTPDGLDRAALDACVGASFFPGIEAGGLDDTSRPIIDAANYAEPYRLDHNRLGPGALTHVMALPWQADFAACGTRWWPVPRPNAVIRGGRLGQSFTAGVADTATDMVDAWHKLGFVVRQGNQHVEVDRCDTISVNLLTPVLDFEHVPQGLMGMAREAALAITFEVTAANAPVTLEYAPGGAPAHPQLVAFNSSVTVGPTGPSGVATARLWVIYRTGLAGSALPPQRLTVRHVGTSSTWTVTVTGDTVARRTTAVALVLDRSGSMTEDRGDGVPKHVSLREAATAFVDVMLENDGVGLVRFNQDAQALQPVLPLGTGGLSDVNRGRIRDLLSSTELDPDGETSIGDGIAEGRNLLSAAGGDFDGGALVVLTDGLENQERWIADVVGGLTASTYAIGFGQPQNISVPALQALSGNTGAYLLVTGAINSDDRFRLHKYFLQVLAGIAQAEVVLDPDAKLPEGEVERFPFSLVAEDSGVDVVLLTPDPDAVDFRLETPSGQLIEPWRAEVEPGMRHVRSKGVAYYRIALPFEYEQDRFDHAGTWHVVVRWGAPRDERTESPNGTDHSLRYVGSAPADVVPGAPDTDDLPRLARRAVLAAEGVAQVDVPTAAARSGGVPFSLLVHAYSSLTFSAHVTQREFGPGSWVDLDATLVRAGVPLVGWGQVWAEVTRPDTEPLTVALAEDDGGRFTGGFAAHQLGTYRIRIRGRGTTPSGEQISREKTLTAVVWRPIA
ncbi:LodA/GoxA family CTQ-dependent oxidase [Cryptosporangium aurantiacum]|uniref:von Willebrand factor type A domain-containing protein n=1 Tax=Cryptosporangium aurantiacum TaxID=134849 RepID=A0A1M7KTD0_9ACTN|nr:LodA/GoxA family CTQ-dependent oxidase [Cryptosporangium aurantiacum]SHM68755.1 von Willebrand factor type A domain-containing protein [Cryptosporangium aurantiacum]